MVVGVQRDVAVLRDEGAVARTARLEAGEQPGDLRGSLEEAGPRPAARVDPGTHEAPGGASLHRPEEERGRAMPEQGRGRRRVHGTDARGARAPSTHARRPT